MHDDQSWTSSTQFVNATRARVYATLAAISILRRFRPRQSSVLFLTGGVCVKYGPYQHISEATTMQFIAEQTGVPVPKVHCAFQRKGITYIVMSRLPGSPIGHEWEQRSQESKNRLLKQLKAHVQDMRSLKLSRQGTVHGLDGGKLYDVRISGGINGFGPFASINSFHEFLRDGAKSSPDQLPEVNELVEKHTMNQYETRFTHGDLNSMNILCHGDDISGIVDWDTAGWYPEYWEFTSATNVNPYNAFWKSEVPKFVDDYPDAARMEGLRQKYFGAI